jgi:hypothetical protein
MAVVGPWDHEDRYIGLSTDTKPTKDVKVGCRFFETDTGSVFLYSGSAWVEEG